LFHVFFILAAEAPKPDIPVSEPISEKNPVSDFEPPSPKANIQAIKSPASKNGRSWMSKRTLNVAEQKEFRSSKDSQWRRQKHEELVQKKRELAEWQAAAKAAAYASQQDATARAGAADADLIDRIDEIEYDMMKTFEEFEDI
jgi:hypothetical protein